MSRLSQWCSHLKAADAVALSGRGCRPDAARQLRADATTALRSRGGSGAVQSALCGLAGDLAELPDTSGTLLPAQTWCCRVQKDFQALKVKRTNAQRIMTTALTQTSAKLRRLERTPLAVHFRGCKVSLSRLCTQLTVSPHFVGFRGLSAAVQSNSVGLRGHSVGFRGVLRGFRGFPRRAWGLAAAFRGSPWRIVRVRCREARKTFFCSRPATRSRHTESAPSCGRGCNSCWRCWRCCRCCCCCCRCPFSGVRCH